MQLPPRILVFVAISALGGASLIRQPTNHTAANASTKVLPWVLSYDGGDALNVTRIESDDNAVAVRFSPPMAHGLSWSLESIHLQTYQSPRAEVHIHQNRAGAPGRRLATLSVPAGPSYPDWVMLELPEPLRLSSDYWVVLEYTPHQGHFYLNDGQSDHPERMLYRKGGAWRSWVDSDWLIRTSGFLTPVLPNMIRPPFLEPIGSYKYKEGQLVLINPLGYDLDGDSVTLSATKLPPGAVFDPVDGLLWWQTGYDQAGTYSGIRFEANDGNGNIDFEEITIEILGWPPGDFDADGEQTEHDADFLLDYLNKTGPPPDPLSAGDLNLDNVVDFDDHIRYLDFLRDERVALGAMPEIKIVHPVDGALVNEEEWVHVTNITGTMNPEKLTLSYSSDGLFYSALPLVPIDDPSYDFNVADVSMLWDTEALPSGEYYLKATYTVIAGQGREERDLEDAPADPGAPAAGGEWTRRPDHVHTSEDIVRVHVNQKPKPFVQVSYDTLRQEVILDASSSIDPERDPIIAYFWHFVCDSTVQEGPVVSRSFAAPDSCDVRLELWDAFENVEMITRVLEYNPPFVAWQEEVTACSCVKLDIIHGQGDRIPKSGSRGKRNTSKLKYDNDKAHGDRKRLGPLDHVIEPDNKTDIALYYMVEATVAGNAEQCSTVQLVAGTLRSGDGKGGTSTKSPTLPMHDDRTMKKKFPFKDNPDKDELGVKEAYTTRCCGRQKFEKAKTFIEKKDGVIRWIGTPGIHVAAEKEKAQPNFNVDKNFDKLFEPNGIEFAEYFYVEILDKVGGGCQSGACKKCFVIKFKYDKNKNREDVTGDNEPDPPTLIEVECPEE